MGRNSRTPSSSFILDGMQTKWEIRIWDPWFEKRIELENGELVPVSIRDGIWETYSGGPPGAVRLNYTGCPMTSTGIENDKLIGCYIQILIDDEVRFVGVIVGYGESVAATEDGGTSDASYVARDLWHAISDKSIDISIPWISPGGVYGLIAGYPYIVYTVSDGKPQIQTTQFQVPLLPVNESDESIVEIDDGIISMQSGSMPRDLRGDISSVMSEVAADAAIDAILIEPTQNKGKGSSIAIIRPVTYGSKDFSIVFGSTELGAESSAMRMPVADNITFSADYSGVINQWIGVGGEITQAAFNILQPAWNRDLDNDVLADPKLPKAQPDKYGAVGTAFIIGTQPWNYSILPFTEVPTNRYPNEAFANDSGVTVQNFRDHAIIWETRAQNGDPSADASWQENTEPSMLMRYDEDLASSGVISIRGKKSTFWDRDKYGVVWFEDPQIDVERTSDGSTVTSTYTYKTMYMQALRTVGTVGYNTGHQGNYPRPRFRYVHDQSWTKRLSTYYSDDPSSRLGFTKGNQTTVGQANLQGVIPSGDLAVKNEDFTPFMISRLDRAVRTSSRPDINCVITTFGYKSSIKPGHRLRSIYNAQGTIIRDELDIIVKAYEISRAEGTTTFFADNRVIF